METLISQLPDICFPSELDTINFGTATSMYIEISVGHVEIFKATLYPEEDGIVRLRDLMPLLSDALKAKGNTPQKLYIIAESDSDYVDVFSTIMPCRVMLTETATAFTTASFLSLISGDKTTFLEAKEYVSVFNLQGGADQERIYITGLYLAADGKTPTQTSIPTAPMETDGYKLVATFDVSPSRLTPPEPGATLITVVVSWGKVLQRFNIAPDGLRQAVGRPRTVEFRNAFGCRETFHFFGSMIREMKPSWKAAVVRGRYKNYSVEAIPRLTLHTGPLADAVLPLLDDLITTTDDIAADDGRTLAVVESEVETSDALAALSEASVTFRETAATRSVRPPRTVHTFDETFDDTFL